MRLDVAETFLYDFDVMNFPAEVTAHDPCSGHVETRNVDLRVASKAITIDFYGGSTASGKTAPAWVATTWADGLPVACDVEV